LKDDPFIWVKRYIELISYKWTPRSTAMKRARRVSQLADKRTKWQYQCAECAVWFKQSGIQLDHIVPKGRYSKETFFVWLDRLFCEADGFQVLCTPCHKKKTAIEHSDNSYK